MHPGFYSGSACRAQLPAATGAGAEMAVSSAVMRRSLPALAAASILLIAACSGSGSATPTPAPPTPGPATSLASTDPGTAAVPACAPGTTPGATVYPGWPEPGRAQATGNMIPYL